MLDALDETFLVWMVSSACVFCFSHRHAKAIWQDAGQNLAFRLHCFLFVGRAFDPFPCTLLHALNAAILASLASDDLEVVKLHVLDKQLTNKQKRHLFLCFSCL